VRATEAFQVSTAITLLLLTIVILISTASNRPTSFDLAVVGEGSDALGREVRAAADAVGVEVIVHELADEAEARRAVDAGEADAALVDAAEIVVRAEPPDQLVGLIQAVSVRERSRRALITAGLTPEEVDAALLQAPLPVDALEPVDTRSGETATVAFVGVLLLYGQLFAYGYWVAAGVVEEKSSRVVEVLLATVRPSHLLRGKILGIGLLGLGQLLLIGLVGLFASTAVGSLDFPSGAVATIGLVLVWFVLGFFFYASLFAVADRSSRGRRTSRRR
jgi:ABC-2 type transport system permease protein